MIRWDWRAEKRKKRKLIAEAYIQLMRETGNSDAAVLRLGRDHGVSRATIFRSVREFTAK